MELNDIGSANRVESVHSENQNFIRKFQVGAEQPNPNHRPIRFHK